MTSPLDFTPELDRYEREARRRLDPLAAQDARIELAAHLAADYEARIELGIKPEEARAQALAALGDVRTVARAERCDPRRMALLLAAPVAMLGWIAGIVIAPVSSWLNGFLFVLQLAILFGPSCALGMFAGLAPVRPWSRFRPFLVGWAMAFGLSVVPIVIAMAYQGPLRALPQGILIWGAGLALPGLAGIALGLLLGTLVRMPGEGAMKRTLGAMRLLAPGIHLALGLAAMPLRAPELARFSLWISSLLLIIGMIDRRRPDLRAILVGVALACGGLMIWSAVPGKGFVVDLGDQARVLPKLGIWIGFVLFILQILALGFWATVRRIAPERRAA